MKLSVYLFFGNGIIARLVAYQFRTNKPKIKNGDGFEGFFVERLVGIF
jgi:hypothetical protein